MVTWTSTPLKKTLQDNLIFCQEFQKKINIKQMIESSHFNPGSAMTGPVRSWRVALTNQDRTGLVNGRH